MTESEWAGIADRLDLVWQGELTEDRRRIYLEALDDLEASQVDRAVGDLIRQGRDRIPSPGALRRVALRGAVLAPFNRLALAGFLLPLVALVAWAGVAAASRDDAGPIPIELLIVAVVGFLLASAALGQAQRGVRRGRGLSWAALTLGSIAVVFGLLSLGQGINESDRQGRDLAEAFGATPGSLSDADDERVIEFSLATTNWNDAYGKILDGFEDGPADDVSDAEQWIRSTPEQIAAMSTAHESDARCGRLDLRRRRSEDPR